MQYLIGTDIGTSGTKTVVMSADGRLMASALEEYGVLYPRALWAEQWPGPWVDAVMSTIQKAVAESGVKKEEIAGLCVSGLYGGAGVPLDGAMRPVRPCIIWMDRRARAQSKRMMDAVGFNRLYGITQNGLDPYYGFTKILWIRDNEPENWERIRLFLPPNAHAIYCLTGEIAIDYSSAGNLGGVFDMSNRRWSGGMLDALGIPRYMMPDRMVESSEIVGRVKPEIARELGLPQGLPVCAGGVDCTVATLGLGVREPGQHVAIIGTSMTWGFVHRDGREARRLITMPFVKDAGKLLFTFGGAATAGATVRWFRNTFAEAEYGRELQGGPNAYACLDDAARNVSAGSEGLLVMPYFMGERAPIWDVNARGVIFGLSLNHTKAHVYRAFLEATAYSLRHTMQAVGNRSGLNRELILAGGAARSPLWRQIFADVTGFRILCPRDNVEANLGDVVLAGMGAGLFGDGAMPEWQVFDRAVEPDAGRGEIYDRYYEQYQALYRSTKDNMNAMATVAELP